MADSNSGPFSVARVGAMTVDDGQTSGSDLSLAIAPVFPQGVAVVRTSNLDDNPLGVSFGSSRSEGEVLICGIRPGEVMVIGSPTSVDSYISRSGLDQVSGTVDIGHGRSVIEVRGSNATGVLEKVCSLDWSDEMMPNGACGSASVAKIVCDVVRSDDGDTRRYLVLCGRSLGRYLHECLLDAASEFRA